VPGMTTDYGPRLLVRGPVPGAPRWGTCSIKRAIRAVRENK